MSGPVSKYSRNLFCTGQLDANGNLFISERVPFRFIELDDTTEYTANAGDTWASLAFAYYGSIEDAASLLWNVIPDFQPVPIVDPTINIVPGAIIYIPSLQTVETLIFAESRRKDFQS